jgi:plasmid stabilization system protein ParE
MAYEVIFTDIANQDFYRILDYIAADSPQNALRFVDKLQERANNTLAAFPFSGTSYKEGIRYFLFDNYVVAYEPDKIKQQVFVYLVSERHRQWRSILDRRMSE